jgi:hypothetical protein
MRIQKSDLESALREAIHARRQSERLYGKAEPSPTVKQWTVILEALIGGVDVVIEDR